MLYREITAVVGIITQRYICRLYIRTYIHTHTHIHKHIPFSE